MKNLLKALVRADGGGSLFGKVMSAGFWAMALRIALRIFVVIRTVILANLLSPQDFGIMGIAIIAILLLERFTEAGFEAALVQKDEDIEPYLNTAWTMQVLRGMVIAAVLFFGAPLIANFFGSSEATAVLQVVALAVVVNSVANIAIVYFQKDLRFDRFFLLQVSDKGTDIVVSIVAALILRNVWALVLGFIAGSVGKTIMSYVIHPFRPRFRWVWHKVKELFNFGKWILWMNMLNYLTLELDDIIVGRVLGVDALGFYRMAFNFSQSMATEVTQVIGQVAFPTYSQLQGQMDKLRRAYFGSLHLASFIGFPLAIGTILIAPDLVYGLLGDQWAPIIVPMQLLSIAGLARGAGATIGPLFMSQGKPNIPPRFSTAKLIMFAVFLYPAINTWGLNGASGVVAVSATITGTAAVWAAFRFLGDPNRQLLETVGYPALNTLVMTAGVLAFRLLPIPEPTTLSFFLVAIVGGLTYLASVALTMRFTSYAAPGALLDKIRGAVDEHKNAGLGDDLAF